VTDNDRALASVLYWLAEAYIEVGINQLIDTYREHTSGALSIGDRQLDALN
jgi:hypothetical protein